MNIFDKLMLARQISFKDGSVAILGNRVVMPPARILSEYSMAINDSPEQISLLYESFKSSFVEMMEKNFTKVYGFGMNDFIKWMTDIAMLTGWGKFTWGDIDKEKKSVVIFVEGCPIGTMLVGKVKGPVDHVVRGFIAGAISIAFKEDVDCIEEECVATGAKRCKFVFGPKK